MEEQGYIQLIKQQTIYVPVMQATLNISMSRIEQMEPFTELVIRAIGQGKTVNDLIDITSLSRYLVEDEIFRLRGWGFIELENENYELTAIGDRYLFLLKLVEQANLDTIHVLVNAFNGQIIPNQTDLLTRDDIPTEGKKLKKKVVKELFQNRNYSNSYEYFIQHHLFRLPKSEELTVDEIETIEVSTQCYPQLYYIAHTFNQIPVVQSIDADLEVEYPFMEIQPHFTTEELEKYQNVLQTIQQLNIFDTELLSNKAVMILDHAKYLEELTEQYSGYYVNLLTGNLVKEIESKKMNTRTFSIQFSCDNTWIKQHLIDNLKDLFLNKQLKIDIELLPIEQKGVIYTNLTKLMNWEDNIVE